MSAIKTFKVNTRNITRVLVAFFLVIGVAFNATALPQTSSIANVQGCQFLHKVEGSSGYGKTQNWQHQARHSALIRAEKLGASHVVWGQIHSVGAYNGVAVAMAYQCH